MHLCGTLGRGIQTVLITDVTIFFDEDVVRQYQEVAG